EITNFDIESSRVSGAGKIYSDKRWNAKEIRRGIRPIGRKIVAMEFLVDGVPRGIEITALVIAGWTGRDRAAVEHHIAELAAIGVKRPRVVPCFYRVGANLLTTSGEVEVAGEDSSGEVEIAGGERFEIELHDPVKNRSLTHEYATRALEIAD